MQIKDTHNLQQNYGSDCKGMREEKSQANTENRKTERKREKIGISNS